MNVQCDNVQVIMTSPDLSHLANIKGFISPTINPITSKRDWVVDQ